MVNQEKMDALLAWSFQSLGEDLLALVLVDRDGLVIASEVKKGVNDEILGGLAALVEPVLKRISSEFKSDSFGAGTFDTEKNRLIFCEAGPTAIVVLVANMLASVDHLFPYAYMISEKVSRLFDERAVSPVVPKLEPKHQDSASITEIKHILVEEGNYILKTVLMGDGGVGKTTLVTQFVEGMFKEDYKSTIGVQIMKKAVVFNQWNAEVRLTIFDLAGQNQFKRVRQTYFAGVRAGLLIYDVTRRETFEHVPDWYEECRAIEKNAILILVANKIDKKEERVVNTEEGKNLAKKLHIDYIETSALDKQIVDDAFTTLALMFLSSHTAFR